MNPSSSPGPPARAGRRGLANVLFVVGWLGWLLYGFLTVYTVTVGWRLTVGDVRQVDWHVYVAGARDLLARTLYERPLDLGGLPMSTPEFNLPPLSAAWAIPLLPLNIELAGTIWQFLNAASVAIASVVAAKIATARHPFLWAGVTAGALAPTLLYLEGLHLGTNNYLVLGLVAGFAWVYRSNDDRAAGILLGLAIATKGWPLTLVPLLVRERRWRVVTWTAAVVAIQGVVFLLWLGPDLLADLRRATAVEIPPTGYLVGPTAVEWARPIWNAGLGLVVAGVVALIPARGGLGLGLGIVAGLAAISNLWIHYAPTLLFAVALMVSAAWSWWQHRSRGVVTL